jgi:hypothetical protein
MSAFALQLPCAARAPAALCCRRALRRAAAGGRGAPQQQALRSGRRGAVAMAGGKESEMKKVESPVSVPVRARRLRSTQRRAARAQP